MLIMKLLYFHGLRKPFFLFGINIVELIIFKVLLRGSELKKTRMSGEYSDTWYSAFSRI